MRESIEYQMSAHHLNLAKTTFFPETLKDYVLVKSLGGGTKSTYLIEHASSGQKLVLKHGSSRQTLCMEIIANFMYRALDVWVPRIEVYTQIPESLKEALKLSKDCLLFQVAEYIEAPPNEQEPERINQAIIHTFMAHVLLGNLDIKEKNFILHESHAYLIDTGCNFVFRALGEYKENPGIVSELDILKDIFSKQTIDDEVLKQQFLHLCAHVPKLEQTLWLVSNALNMGGKFHENILGWMSERFFFLQRRLCSEYPHFANIFEKALPGQTSAGILTYVIKNGQAGIYLHQRVKHGWYANLGGKSDFGDNDLLDTSLREVKEESSGCLLYDKENLLLYPFHDFITGPVEAPCIYRLYIAEHEEIALEKITDKEDTDHQWVLIKDIIDAINENTTVQLEDQTTILVNGYALFPPLYRLLQEPPVLENLKRLAQGLPVKRTHTARRDIALPLNTSSTIKQRPFVHPSLVSLQINETLILHTPLMRALQNKTHLNNPHDRILQPLIFSQSEIHLKAILGESYVDNNIPKNLELFFSTHYSLDLESDEKETLIKNLTDCIQQERQWGDTHFFFYHAVDSKVSFVYELYMQIMHYLTIHPQGFVGRIEQDKFEKFESIFAFIDKLFPNGDIDNDVSGYADLVQCCNIFVGGNHLTDISCSLYYFLNNYTRREIDLQNMLTHVFARMGFSASQIQFMANLYPKENKKLGGVLYQIGILKEVASKWAYASGFKGVHQKFSEIEEPLNLPLIITAFQQNPELIVEHKDYLKNVQARLMLWPNQGNFLKTVRFAQCESAFVEVSRHIQHNMPQIMRSLLNNPVSRPVLGNRLTLFKIQSNLYQYNQLPQILAGDYFSVDDLLLAVDTKDGALMMRILRSNPELMVAPSGHFKHETRITFIELLTTALDKGGFECFVEGDWEITPLKDFNLTKEESSEFAEICIRQTRSLDMLIAILSASQLFQEFEKTDRMNLTAKLIETVEFEENKTIGSNALSVIMMYLPPSLTHFFFIKYVEKNINFYDIRYFISNMSEETLTYVLQRYEKKILKSSIWIEFLPYLPKTQLPGFIEKHEKTLYAEADLLKVLPYVDVKKQSQFLWHHEKVLETGEGMIAFLQTCHFTEISKLKFFEKHENNISNARDLVLILSLVFEHKNYRGEERIYLEKEILRYVLKYANIITTKNEYITVGNEFGDLRDAFHEQFLEKAQTLSQVRWGLGYITSIEKRVKIFEKHADKIQSKSDVKKIFRFLAAPVRFDAVVYFIKNHAEKIDSREFFAQLIVDIPLEKWSGLFQLFAISRKDHNEYDLDDAFYIFDIINDKRQKRHMQGLDPFEFVLYFQDLFVKDAETLLKTLSSIEYNISQELLTLQNFIESVALHHLDKIQDENTLLELLDYLSDKYSQFNCALKLCTLITTEYGLVAIMKKIKDPTLNLKLVLASQPNITFGIYFKKILKYLPKKEHLNFALNCRFNVATIRQLDETLNCMDEEIRNPLESLFKSQLENNRLFFKSDAITIVFSEQEKQNIKNNK